MRPTLSFALALFPLIATNALCAAQTTAPTDSGGNVQQQAADSAFVDAERRLTIRLLDRAIAQADADAVLLGQVASASKDLTDRVTALRTNEEGKRLAAALDELSAGQVQQLINDPPVLPEVLASKQKENDSISADLKTLRADPPTGFVLPDKQEDELSQSSVSLRQLLARTHERDQWLTGLMSGAPKLPDPTKAPTLDAALSNFRARQQEAWNAAQRTGIDEAKPESLQQITEAARIAELGRSLEQSQAMLAQSRQATELARLDADTQLRLLKEQKDSELAIVNKKLAESEAHRAVVAAQTDATLQKGKADAEEIRLRQKCDDPEVKKLLAPFLADGIWQPGDRPGRPWLHQRGPVSLSALKKFGALEANERGLTQLYVAGNGVYADWPHQLHPDKDRPKWGFPRAPVLLSQEDWQKLRHIQGLLNELGETMVEQKMLVQ